VQGAPEDDDPSLPLQPDPFALPEDEALQDLLAPGAAVMPRPGFLEALEELVLAEYDAADTSTSRAAPTSDGEDGPVVLAVVKDSCEDS
jgi:hypothetical protein